MTPSFLDGRTKGLFIDGRTRPALSGKTFDSVSPRNGEVLATLAQAGREDIDPAVAAARRAFEGEWGRFKPFRRARRALCATAATSRTCATRGCGSSASAPTRFSAA